MFSPLQPSTLTATGKLSNVKHNEKEFIKVLEDFMKTYTGPIKTIDCNYGHLVNKTYTVPNRAKRSNRGRKRKVSKRRVRKIQGDGTCFNSQITFGVHGGPVDVDYVPSAIKRNGKIYKIKVFRTGEIQIPGVLMEDMSDVLPPLGEICKCFSTLLSKDVQIESLYSVMRNFKYCLLPGDKDRHIDVHEMHEHLLDFLISRHNINFTTVRRWMIDHTQSSARFDFNELKSAMISDTGPKNILISFSNFKDKLEKYKIPQALEAMRTAIDNMIDYNELLEPCSSLITRFYVWRILKPLEKDLIESDDNIISHVAYNPEKYPGLLIKFKTPIPGKPKKETTVKVFDSGKCNVDGANCREEAEKISQWINSVLTRNREELIYCSDDSDSDAESDSD